VFFGRYVKNDGLCVFIGGACIPAYQQLEKKVFNFYQKIESQQNINQRLFQNQKTKNVLSRSG